MISAQPGVTPMKPGAASLPSFGIEPVLIDNEGRLVEGPGEGNLCFKCMQINVLGTRCYGS